ncbi:protein winged eye isoform X2 [Diorhabda sublineata]|uniref:protein winged eye isoform X2 n=1 Tax=Diorhabda sublineata TaxID=1163346 RepID=UPI0024E0665D|nr:protein winged eye isoform X2 [Diorhabda sublineata]XP_056638736.1 protein winged eye isoform X2 [Diorhabda sublineata]
MLGSPSGTGLPNQRGLWPLSAVQTPTISTFPNDGLNKYGVYSLFSGGPSFGSTLYSHSSTSSTTGRFATGQYPQPTDNIFQTSYKVSDSLFSTTSYTFGAPTPPPGSPYSPIPIGQFELLAKGINSNLLQPVDASLALQQSPKKIHEKHCEKCCNYKSQFCSCQISTIDHSKLMDPLNCCTRTNTLKWNEINMKKEPTGHISEISTNSASMIKLEVMSPTQQTPDILGNNIIGLADPSSATMTVNSATLTNNLTDNTVIHCTDNKTTEIETKHVDAASYIPPSVWQYSPPVAPVPVEPLVPVPPVGLQVVRDPNTGGLLLLSTNSLDSLQQAVVWSGYPQHSPMLLPSIPPVPSPSFQLVQSTPSHCFSGTFHQQTQAHSTRLVALTTDNKRKIPTTTLIKIETDQAKTLQPVSSTATSTATVITDVTPLITTHVIYQHPTNFIVSQSPATEPVVTQTICKSQATSPVTYLTPPPEFHSKETKVSAVQDASNQTDAVVCTEEIVTPEVPEKPPTPAEVPDITIKPMVDDCGSHLQEVIVEPESPKEPAKLVLSGLELLSNSIDQFESSLQKSEIIPTDREPPKNSVPLDGLNLLCALAEQRIMEENEKPVVECENLKKRKKDKRKSKRHSTDEPKRKKLKSGKHYHEKKKHKKLKNYQEERECSCEKYQTSTTEETNIFVVKNLFDKNLIRNDQDNENESSLMETKKFKHLKKHFRSKSVDFDRSTISSPIFDQPLLKFIKPSDLMETPKLDFKHQINQTDFDGSSEKHSSSKKRKVGRPRKLMPFSTEQVTTETIVAKKPKSNFIGCLLAAKEKFRLQNKTYNDGIDPSFEEDGNKVRYKKSKHRNSAPGELRTSKIKPKLKAEPTLKPAEECDSADENEEDIVINTVEEEEEEDAEDKAFSITDRDSEDIMDRRRIDDNRCILTAALLEVDKLRVLTAMGGLFYAGHLNAIEPPDVYSIVLDGERGNKPHIMSREEILRDAIVEVAPQNTNELLVGTRVCAYWSQQYRCLYPGSIAEPSSPDPELDGKFVLVEFDDGDSGRIDLKDIRLLPSDYPVIEYDLNPLLSLTKRKKKVSKNIISKYSVQEETNTIIESKPELKIPFDDNDITDKLKTLIVEKHMKKKLLKKKKREKLHTNLSPDKKKRRKKHKCYDKKCKDRKHHKKHRKHKKHHDKSRLNVGVNSLENDVIESNIVVEECDENIEDYKDDDITIDIEQQPVPNDSDVSTKKKATKLRDRQESCESRSKMSAFLPARQLWGWAGKEYKRQRTKGRFRKFFYKSIRRGKETITVGDSAVFLSTGRPDRPYIGKIEAMWELFGTMIVKVKWFYHPEETIGCPQNLQYPGALFESPHIDENDVQTISHKCEVVPLKEYTDRIGDDPKSYATIYDNNDIYYLAGYYDPTTHSMKIEPGIPFSKT